MRPSNGWIGSTTAAGSSRSGTSRPQKPRPTSTQLGELTPWPRNQQKPASGKPGALHIGPLPCATLIRVTRRLPDSALAEDRAAAGIAAARGRR